MRFGPRDEDAYFTRRDELAGQFTSWLAEQSTFGDPSDAVLLMDWRWGYGDGQLDRWRVTDVAEFLFEWCPRKLSAPPEYCADVPATVAAFVEFLAHNGMRRGGDTPAAIREYCETGTTAFVKEMGDPANHGMAKSLFGSVGGLEPGADLSADGISALMQQLPDTAVLPWEADDDDDEPAQLGPVRVPTDADRHASAASAPALVAMRTLAEYCAAPGRALTTKGNLRLADARHLVEVMQTGDDPTLGGRRALTSAQDLPGLDWMVELAIGAGVVRRQRGKLVGVAKFAGLDDVTAHAKLARTAIDGGLARRPHPYFPVVDQIDAVIEASVFAHLAGMLAGELDLDDLAEAVGEVVEDEFPGLPGMFIGPIPARLRSELDRLATLGVVELRDEETVECATCSGTHPAGGSVALTPAGTGVVVDMARESGLEVLLSPDPVQASADEMVDLIGAVDERGWNRDLDDWFAAQPDPATATTELADAVVVEHREALVVLAGLDAVARLGGDHAVPAVRAHLKGPWDGLVANWLLARSAIGTDEVDPVRLVHGLIDILGAALDAGGPQELVSVFEDGTPQQHTELLETIWRAEHPRLAEILEALGAHHPVKATAKAARKALTKHRSMLADRRSKVSSHRA